jgi:hypothetical protein
MDQYVKQSSSRHDAYKMASGDYRDHNITKAEYDTVMHLIRNQPERAWRIQDPRRSNTAARKPTGKKVSAGPKKPTAPKKQSTGLSPKEFRNGMALFMGKGLSKADAYRKMKYYTGSPEQVHKFRKYRASENGLSNGAFRGGMATLMKKGDSKQTAYEKMQAVAKANRSK